MSNSITKHPKIDKTMGLPRLKVSEKYSIAYDPQRNDSPRAIYRHGEARWTWPAVDLPNWVLSLFYFALERSGPEDIERGNS